jgi:nucleoid-associated protein YgaU
VVYVDGFGVITIRSDGSVVNENGSVVSGISQETLNAINQSTSVQDYRTTPSEQTQTTTNRSGVDDGAGRRTSTGGDGDRQRRTAEDDSSSINYDIYLTDSGRVVYVDGFGVVTIKDGVATDEQGNVVAVPESIIQQIEAIPEGQAKEDHRTPAPTGPTIPAQGYQVYDNANGRQAYVEGYGIVTIAPNGTVTSQTGNATNIPAEVITAMRNSTLVTTQDGATRTQNGQAQVYRNGAWTAVNPGAGNGGGTQTPAPIAGSSSPMLTSGISNNPLSFGVVGQPWTLTISGNRGEPVYIVGGMNGQTTRTLLGTIGNDGKLVVSGVFGQGEVGNWQEQYVVVRNGRDVSVGNASFTVYSSPTAMPSTTPINGSTATVDGVTWVARNNQWQRSTEPQRPTSAPVNTPTGVLSTANGQPLTAGAVGQNWRLVIRGNPNEQVYIVGGMNGQTTRTLLGTIGGNNELVVTGTFSESEVGDWNERYVIVRNGQDVSAGSATFRVQGAQTGTPSELGITPTPGATATVGGVTWTVQEGQWVRATTANGGISSAGVFSGQAPVGANGQLLPGWTVSGNRYYNTQTGVFSNRDGSIQARTGNEWGDGMLRASVRSLNLTYYDTNQALTTAVDNGGGGFNIVPYNPAWGSQDNYSFITYEGAQQVLAWLNANGITGGQIVTGSVYNRNAPEYMIHFSNGTSLNAGLVGQAIMREGYNAIDNLQAEASRPGTDRLGVNVQVATGTPRDLFAPSGGANAPVNAGSTIIQNSVATNANGQVPTALTNATVQVGQNLSTASATVVVISNITALNEQGQNAGSRLGPNYKIEIGGQGLNAYNRFELVINSQIFNITSAVISENKITLTVPNNIPGTFNNAPTRIKLSSANSAVTQGLMGPIFFYTGSVALPSSGPGASGSGSGARTTTTTNDDEDDLDLEEEDDDASSFWNNVNRTSGTTGSGSRSTNPSTTNTNSVNRTNTTSSTTIGTTTNAGSTATAVANGNAAAAAAAAATARANSLTETGASTTTTSRTTTTSTAGSGSASSFSRAGSSATARATNNDDLDLEEEEDDDAQNFWNSLNGTGAGSSGGSGSGTGGAGSRTGTGNTGAGTGATGTGSGAVGSGATGGAGAGGGGGAVGTGSGSTGGGAGSGATGGGSGSGAGAGTTTTTADTAQTQTITQLTAQIGQLEGKITALTNQLNAPNQTSADLQSARNEITGLRQQITNLTNSIAQLQANPIRVFDSGITMQSGLQFPQGLQMPAGYPASGGAVNADAYWNNLNQGQVQSAKITKGSYTVKKGDSLWKIAKKYYGDGAKWRKILEANPDCLARRGDTKTLKVGFNLVIPE